MDIFYRSLTLMAAAALICCTPGAKTTEQSAATVENHVPRLEKRGDVTQLIVGGKPFIALSGELHNSSSSHDNYLTPIWPKLKEAGLNTVLAVISWEQVEPQEGVFDFSTVDDLVKGARENDMKVMILWFGSWKNGITSYVPAWVQKDTARFPLIRTKDGKTLNILSTFGAESAKADAKAYAAMMNHLEEIDSVDRTVIMIQVENEVGLHGDTRDYRPEAVAAFDSAVPAQLMEYLTANYGKRLLPELEAAWDKAGHKTSGTWEEVFGRGDYTDELFMAWHYAKYLDVVAAAGKAEYPLPTFVNAWIVQPEDKHPGDYPAGGPQAQNHDMWRAAAPSIDMLCPDIYLPDFPAIIEKYSRLGNPVFVPESAAGVGGAANAYYAVAQMGAIGYSPFGIEARLGDVPAENGIAIAYKRLAAMNDVVAEHQAAGTIRGAWLKQSNPAIHSMEHELGGYKIKFALRTTRNSTALPAAGYGLVMMTAPGEYIVSGFDCEVTFTPADAVGIAGLSKVEEGDFVNNRWVGERWLNGDEIQLRYDLLQAEREGLSGQGLRFRGTDPKLQKVSLYTYR